MELLEVGVAKQSAAVTGGVVTAHCGGNPYWDKVIVTPGEPITLKYRGTWEPAWYSHDEQGRYTQHREPLVTQYAWAIPDPESLAFVAKYLAPKAVEMGAGTGYWASLLAQLGVDILAFDAKPPQIATDNHWHSPAREDRHGFTHETREVFCPVYPGDPQTLAAYPDRALFLCWPPYAEPMAAEALAAYPGPRLVYIGEGQGGCTADDDFFTALASEWTEIASHRGVQWSGIHDYITVYERAKESDESQTLPKNKSPES